MAIRRRLLKPVKSTLLPKKAGSFHAKGALATGRGRSQYQTAVKAAAPRRVRFRLKPAKHS